MTLLIGALIGGAVVGIGSIAYFIYLFKDMWR